MTRERPKPIAILCSDLHFSLDPPYWCGTSLWRDLTIEAMKQLRRVQETYNVPLLCAGDVFHHWRQHPEIINLATKHLPQMVLAIPGQHDLPYHNSKYLSKSAFDTLCLTGTIQPCLLPHIETTAPDFALTGFPYDKGLRPTTAEKEGSDRLKIAMIHRFVWSKNVKESKDFNAPKMGEAGYICRLLSGYNVIVSGDNHKHFVDTQFDERNGIEQTLINCGSFMPRSIKELGNDDWHGLTILFNNGAIAREETVCLPTLKRIAGKYAKTGKGTESPDEDADMRSIDDVVSGMKKIRAEVINFEQALRKYLRTADLPKEVVEASLQCLEN